MDKKKVFCILLMFLGCILNPVTLAQFGSEGAVDARSMGMGKSYNASTTGIYSIGINPANLINTQDRTTEFQTILPIPYLAFRSGTNFMTFDDLNYFFGGVNGKARYLDDEDKKRFNDLFEDGGVVFANVSVNLLSVSYNYGEEVGAFAFSAHDFISAYMKFPQSITDLALFGNQPGKNFDLGETDIQSWWIRTYSLSYARELSEIRIPGFNKFGAGISFKLVHGFSYTGTERVLTSFITGEKYQVSGSADLLAHTSFSDAFGVKYGFDSTEKKSNMSLFPSPAGAGVGFDVGVNAQYLDNWIFSLAVTDIGKINWKKNVAEFSASGEIEFEELLDRELRDSLYKKITGEGKSVSNHSTSMPTTLRLGAAFYTDENQSSIPGSLIVVLDYNQGFNNMPGNTTTPRVSIGGEWKPGDWFPYFRTGFSFGGRTGLNWAFGIGAITGSLELNFATSDFHVLFAPNSSKQVSFAVSSRWRF